MRPIILIALLVSASVLKAQTFFPQSSFDRFYGGGFASNIHLNDTGSQKKWSVSRYSGISTSFSVFRGGNATIVSAPIGLQLNRRLNNNLYAFAGVSVAPAYVNFNRTFMAGDFSKTNQHNSFFNTGSLGLYSKAELGLQYVNDERTFSISGSIGVSRASYPFIPYAPINNTRPNQVITGAR